jgi:hypothetical protein
VMSTEINEQQSELNPIMNTNDNARTEPAGDLRVVTVPERARREHEAGDSSTIT